MGIPDFERVEKLAGLFSSVQHAQGWQTDKKCQRGDHEGVEKTDPSISMIRVNWLYSLVPGKRGNPRNSSTAMHPSDHISIEVL